jgi:hypothetical protein
VKELTDIEGLSAFCDLVVVSCCSWFALDGFTRLVMRRGRVCWQSRNFRDCCPITATFYSSPWTSRKLCSLLSKIPSINSAQLSSTRRIPASSVAVMAEQTDSHKVHVHVSNLHHRRSRGKRTNSFSPRSTSMGCQQVARVSATIG